MASSSYFNLDDDSESIQVVTFKLGEENYCLNINDIFQIINARECVITKVPRQPPFMEGITNRRGDVIPILDLRKRLGLPPTGHEKSKVIIVNFHEHFVGFIVDSVDEHTKFPRSEIKPASDMLAGRSQEFILGLIEREGESLLMLLDPIKVLDSAQREALEKLMEGHG